MDLIVSRLLSPPILAWLVITFLGSVASLGTLLIMRYEIKVHPPALEHPRVQQMKRHDITQESGRFAAQFIAVGIGIGYVCADIASIWIAWALVVAQAVLTFNSLNEFTLTIRLIGRDRRSGKNDTSSKE